jgi:DNA-binding transcriptional LysR family regulator
MTHNNLMSVKKYVTLGLGAALVSDFAVSREEERTIDVFPMDRYFAKRKYGLLLRKKKYISPVVKAFIRTIKPDMELAK